MKLRPSSAWRWCNCPASPHLIATCGPQPESDPAREGTCAAWVAECVIRGDAETCFDMIDRSHQNGWLVTPEMAADVQEYVDLLRSRGGQVLAELKVKLSDEPLIEGTLDAASISVSDRTLFVDDLKYGHKVVEVWQNYQLLIYASALFFFGSGDKPMVGAGQEIDKIQIGIYQPRSFHVDGIYRTWTITVEELLGYANWIIERGRAALDPNAIAIVGSWCNNCEAATRCETLAHTSYSLVDTIASNRHREMTPEERSRELDFCKHAQKVIEARVSAIESESEALMIAGTYIPHYTLESRNGKRRWKPDVDPELVKLLTGIDIRDTSKLITPKAAENAKMDPDLLQSLVTQPKLPPKITRVNNSRADMMFEPPKGNNHEQLEN